MNESVNEWIYESADGGKTIMRRPGMNYEYFSNGRHLLVDTSEWISINDASKIAIQCIKEQKIRSEYPALNDLWEQYRVMLSLISSGDNI